MKNPTTPSTAPAPAPAEEVVVVTRIWPGRYEVRRDDDSVAARSERRVAIVRHAALPRGRRWSAVARCCGGHLSTGLPTLCDAYDAAVELLALPRCRHERSALFGTFFRRLEDQLLPLGIGVPGVVSTAAYRLLGDDVAGEVLAAVMERHSWLPDPRQALADLTSTLKKLTAALAPLGLPLPGSVAESDGVDWQLCIARHRWTGRPWPYPARWYGHLAARGNGDLDAPHDLSVAEHVSTLRWRSSRRRLVDELRLLAADLDADHSHDVVPPTAQIGRFGRFGRIGRIGRIGRVSCARPGGGRRWSRW